MHGKKVAQLSTDYTANILVRALEVSVLDEEKSGKVGENARFKSQILKEFIFRRHIFKTHAYQSGQLSEPWKRNWKLNGSSNQYADPKRMRKMEGEGEFRACKDDGQTVNPLQHDRMQINFL